MSIRPRVVAMVATLALVLAASCAPPRPPTGEEPEPAVQPPPPPEGPLRLLAVLPPPDLPLVPGDVLRLIVDRPLDAGSAAPDAVRLEYVASRRRFVVDPFRYTARRLESAGSAWSLALDPPDFLPGEVVRLTLGPAFRARDGGTLPELEAGGTLSFEFQVREIPPEAP